MAKEAAKKNPEKKIGRTAKDEGFEFGIDDFAKELNCDPTVARQKLRKAGVQKKGTTWGWKNRRDMDIDKKKVETASKPARNSDEPKSAKKAAAKKTPAKKAPGRPREEDSFDEEGDEAQA